MTRLNTSRRGLLGVAAALGAVGAAGAPDATAAIPTHPDAKLLAACAELMAIEAESLQLWDQTLDLLPREKREVWAAAERHTAAFKNRVAELERTVVATPATSLEGLRAKAAYTMTFSTFRRGGERDEMLAFSVFNDLLSGSVVA